MYTSSPALSLCLSFRAAVCVSSFIHVGQFAKDNLLSPSALFLNLYQLFFFLFLAHSTLLTWSVCLPPLQLVFDEPSDLHIPTHASLSLLFFSLFSLSCTVEFKSWDVMTRSIGRTRKRRQRRVFFDEWANPATGKMSKPKRKKFTIFAINKIK